MSANITVATRDYIACATDRRLTRPNGEIVTERSMKLSAFVCANARGIITYNGIGSDRNGVTPNDWISEITNLSSLTLDNFLERIKEIAEPRIAELSAEFGGNPRHTFVISAFLGQVPVMAMISNYESLGHENEAEQASAALTLERMGPAGKSAKPHFVVATGDKRRAHRTVRERIIPRVKAGAAYGRVVPQMVKAVRDCAYEKNRKGTVGTSVVTCVWPVTGNAVTEDHVVGGSSLKEAPNFLGPGGMIKDIWFQAIEPGAPFESRFDPLKKKAVIRESRCTKCGAPVPEGYSQCGVCDRRVA